MTVSYQKMSFSLDRGVHSRAAIGLIVLATDQTIEYEWRHLIDMPDVVVFEGRLYNSPDINPTTLAAMEKDIAPISDLIRPGKPLDVVAFGCTSGAMVIGEDKVFSHIRSVHPQVPCTTPITAGIAGLHALGVKRIGLLTPYLKAINDWMREYIEKSGIEVAAMTSYEHADDTEVARIDRASIEAGVLSLAKQPGVDGVFVSCTSLRVAHFVADLERMIGKPVTSSNHAMAWHSLRLAGVKDALPQHGRLFAI